MICKVDYVDNIINSERRRCIVDRFNESGARILIYRLSTKETIMNDSASRRGMVIHSRCRIIFLLLRICELINILKYNIRTF